MYPSPQDWGIFKTVYTRGMMNVAYDKTTDLESIQADVLTTDTTDNTKITKLKQLKTDTKVPTKAINALNEQLGNAQESASDALQRVVALENRLADSTPADNPEPQTNETVVVVQNADVGYVTWQLTLLTDHLALDGQTVTGADYPELLAFAVDHQLVTADADDMSLFRYDETTDALTLPNYVDLVLQGGTMVKTEQAGLPNINTGDGQIYIQAKNNASLGPFSNNVGSLQKSAFSWQAYPDTEIHTTSFDASRCSPVYGASSTVQPPAIKLIPQIRCRSTSLTSTSVNMQPLTSTQVATLIDNFGK